MNNTILGIIGGMGPEASADFYMKLVKMTKVEKDQDHYRIIIDSNSKIPDRTKAILHNGESPVEEIIKSARGLGELGVQIACIPCMTSHYFIKEIMESVDYRIIDIFEALKNYINKEFVEVEKIGVVATSGTVQMDLFSSYLGSDRIVYPDPHIQEKKVMEAIYGSRGIKSGVLEGEPVDLLVAVSKHLIDKGAGAIILGCTEIGLALKQDHVSIPLIDPLDVVARIMTTQE